MLSKCNNMLSKCNNMLSKCNNMLPLCNSILLYLIVYTLICGYFYFVLLFFLAWIVMARDKAHDAI